MEVRKKKSARSSVRIVLLIPFTSSLDIRLSSVSSEDRCLNLRMQPNSCVTAVSRSIPTRPVELRVVKRCLVDESAVSDRIDVDQDSVALFQGQSSSWQIGQTNVDIVQLRHNGTASTSQCKELTSDRKKRYQGFGIRGVFFAASCSGEGTGRCLFVGQFRRSRQPDRAFRKTYPCHASGRNIDDTSKTVNPGK
jgi:hypothetical protein